MKKNNEENMLKESVIKELSEKIPQDSARE